MIISIDYITLLVGIIGILCFGIICWIIGFIIKFISRKLLYKNMRSGNIMLGGMAIFIVFAFLFFAWLIGHSILKLIGVY